MPAAGTPENTCAVADTGEVWLNYPEGETAYFEVGGCGDPNSFKLNGVRMVGPGVDCVMSDWSNSGSCSTTCGDGTQTQTRTVLTRASFGGTACPTDLTQEVVCSNSAPCDPVDCVVSDWTDSGSCCRFSTQTQIRTIQTEAAHGGTACPTDLTRETTCSNQDDCDSSASFGPDAWNYNSGKASITDDGTVATLGGCFAATLKFPMPPNTGTYVYDVAIKDLGMHSNVGVVTDDYGGTFSWGAAGLYTWCHCADHWNHGLGGSHKGVCNRAAVPNSNVELSVHVDTDSSPPRFYWNMPTAGTPENTCTSADSGELWMNYPEGKTAYFEVGGCGNPNSFKLKAARTFVPVPQDCVMSDWANSGSCSTTCGDGTQTQTRTVQTEAAHGGTACPTDLTQDVACSNLPPCPVDCVMSDWANSG